LPAPNKSPTVFMPPNRMLLMMSEDRLAQRIVDGDRQELEADLDLAMQTYTPLVSPWRRAGATAVSACALR
jgi:hypothetical protein